MTPELVLDARAVLGEGPVWHPRLNLLLWLDIKGHALHILDPVTARDRVLLVNEPIGCVAPAGGSLVIAGLKSGLAAIDLETGRRAHVADPEVDLPGNRFNDGKCDPAGRFWVGTMRMDESPNGGALYCLDQDLAVRCKVPGVSISNGLAWSMDERTMYYVDSPTRRVVAYDYDRTTGEIVRPRPVFEVPGEPFPDGMTIDADGCLWVALWDGWRVVRVDPDFGRIVDAVEMPVARPTACTFGGSALDELYITSARTDLSHEQLATQPAAGGLFVVRPGVRGLPAVEFAGADRLQAMMAGTRDQGPVT